MLFECSCEATKELVDQAINDSVALQPRNDTPLAALVNTTTVVPVTDLTAALVGDVRTIATEVLAEQSNNSLHNSHTDEISDAFAATIQRRIEIIRTTVIPAVKSVTDQVLHEVDAANLNQNTLDVVRYHVCDMINIPSFMGEVTRNTGSSYMSPDSYFKEEPTSIDKVMELLKSGSTAADAALAVAVNRIGADELFRIWESLFVDRGRSTVAGYGTFDQFVMNAENGLDNAIIIYQLASTLAKNDVQTAKQYLEAAAYQISLYAKAYNRDIEAGVLIRNISNNIVQVYGVNYVKFLQKGGTSEMVIGAAAQPGVYMTIDSILDVSQDMMKNYTVLKSAKSLEFKAQVRRIANASFLNAFLRSFKHEKSEFEAAYFEKNQSAEQAIIDKFETTYDMVGTGNMMDLYRRITEILCNTRFAYLDCYGFMSAIDEMCGEGLSADEALTQATLQEICTSVVSMIKAK